MAASARSYPGATKGVEKMRHARRLGPWIGLVISLAAAGCVPQDGDQPSVRQPTAASASASTPGQPRVEPRPGLSPTQRFRLAVEHLEDGQFDAAEVELVAYLSAVPNSSRARHLLEQLTTPPAELLGSDSFQYRIGEGESLSTIADKYLGDPLLFVALARFNDIARPNNVVVGQTLRIPGTPGQAVADEALTGGLDKVADRTAAPKPDQAPGPPTMSASAAEPETDAQDPPAEDPAQRTMTTAADADPGSAPGKAAPGKEGPGQAAPSDQALERGEDAPPANAGPDGPGAPPAVDAEPAAAVESAPTQTEAALAAVDAELTAPAPAEPMSELEVLASAETLLASGAFEEALELLRGPYQSDRDSGRLRDQLVEAHVGEAKRLAPDEPQKAAEHYAEAGVLLASANARYGAFEAFEEALQLDPDQPIAQERFQPLREDLADDLHRQAVEAFQKQNLDRAVELWERVVRIDPRHVEAGLQLERARKMQDRMQRLRGGQP